MVTVAEYARKYGLSRQYVHRLVKAGRLEAVKAYGRLMVSEDAVYKRAGKRYRDQAQPAPYYTKAIDAIDVEEI